MSVGANTHSRLKTRDGQHSYLHHGLGMVKRTLASPTLYLAFFILSIEQGQAKKKKNAFLVILIMVVVVVVVVFAMLMVKSKQEACHGQKPYEGQ